MALLLQVQHHFGTLESVLRSKPTRNFDTELETSLLLNKFTLFAHFVKIRVQFNSLSCRLKSTSAYYQFSTKTQMKHKNCKNTHKKLIKHNKYNRIGKAVEN